MRIGDRSDATLGRSGVSPGDQARPVAIRCPITTPATRCRAAWAAEVLKLFFGTDHIPFTICSTTVGAGGTCTDPTPVLRSYKTFSQAADENAVSRIYIGIHFRRAVEEGTQHGRRISRYAVRKFMRPVR
jgi:hypothetical protein